MTKEELSKWLAEQIMGWTYIDYLGIWCLDPEEPVKTRTWYGIAWDPTDDEHIHQAFMCIKALELPFTINYSIVSYKYGVSIYSHSYSRSETTGHAENKSLALALCQAIREARS